ncbi:MAG: hypothetical protein FJ403_09955 [Verrucomicrobia bacterium]|nr:hypothetical protein [Verrucomicrobiota bacterium]
MIACSQSIRWLLFVSTLVWCAGLLAQQDRAPGDSPAQSVDTPLKSIGDGIFKIGEVRFNKQKKQVWFPGTVNLTDVVIEYGIVGPGGKLHEGLLATPAHAQQIHLAMLLLGMTNQTARVESGQPLTGAPIHIFVAWTSAGKETKVRLEDLICKQKGGAPMERGFWLYNGSRVLQGVFMAHASESIAAIIEDIDALVNNPRQGREDDEIWFPNEKAVPPLNTPVTITFEPAGTGNSPK